MDKRFDRIEEKLDKIAIDIGDMKLVQVDQAKDLKYHIARTDQIEDQLLPLVKIKTTFDGMFKLVGIIGSAFMFIFGAIKAFESLLSFL